MSFPTLSSRLRIALWSAVVFVALITLIGIFVLPPIVKAQLERRVSEALGRTTTVGAVKFNPYTLGLTIERLDVQRLDKSGSFAGWDRLYVNADVIASLGGTLSLHAVELDGFHVAASIEADGRFNFADILEKLQAAGAEGRAAEKTSAKVDTPPKPLALHVGRLAVGNARVDFADRSRAHPFATVLGPVSFNVTEFRTVTERGAPFHFAAVTESGEKFEWHGTLASAPFSSRGELAIEQVALPKYAAYYADRLGVDVIDGRLSAKVAYEVKLDGAQRVARVSDGGVQLRGLKLTERGTQEVALDVPVLDVNGFAFDAVALQGRAAAVRVNGPAIAARREANGAINWERFFIAPPMATTGAPATPATSASPTAGTALDFALDELSVTEARLAFTDLALPRKASLALEGVGFSLKQFSLRGENEMPVSVSFDWKPTGRFSAEGVVALRPELRAVLQTELSDFALLPLSPYLEQQLNARLTQGALSFAQKISASMPADGAPVVEATGSLRLAELGLVDVMAQEELAGLGAFELAGMRVRTTPRLDVSIDGVTVARPYARVVVREDRSINLATVAATAAPTQSASATTASESAPMATPAQKPIIRIGGVAIEGGSFSLTDRSITPQVRMALGEFGGTIGEMSSAALARAKVDLRGVVDAVGPVAIRGELDPLGSPRFVDLQVEVRNVDLLPLSPYSGKYAGYELARGKFGLEVKARLEGDRLNSENVITLGQFTFGAPVESKDATKLPVRLGVALLKDMNGQIVIDVPMSGDVNDPELRIGKVVWRVVGNLLTKAAVSPFALVGSMFGGGGEELAFQQFEPGASTLTPTAREKLDTMIKALTARPGLSLGIDGAFDTAADAYALKRVKLEALVRGRIWEARRAADPNLPPPDRLEITPDERVAQVKQLFEAKFPPGTEFGTPLPQPPAVVEPPPAPQGFFKRAVRLLTFTSRREKRAAEAANAQRAAEHAAAVEAAKAAGVPLDDMVARLAETIEVTEDDLRALAEARAARVRDYFLNEGKIAPDRLFLTKAPPAPAAPADAPAAESKNRGPRVFLTLQ